MEQDWAEGIYAAHHGALWGLCYRMVGSSSDADDLVQATFERVLARPPQETQRDLRPWLVRVAMNLSRDHLRRRRKATYTGPWLPQLVETAQAQWGDGQAMAPEGRYSALESVTMAFLVALEALTPSQRAVLLLRDVLDYSGAQTAQALEMSVSNVKTTLHRARRAMVDYDASRRAPDQALCAEMEATLMRLVTAWVSQDAQALEALLANDVQVVTDAGGQYAAATRLVSGRARVMAFMLGLARKNLGYRGARMVNLGGLPVLVTWMTPSSPRFAPMSMMTLGLDGDGRVSNVWSIQAPDKLPDVEPL